MNPLSVNIDSMRFITIAGLFSKKVLMATDSRDIPQNLVNPDYGHDRRSFGNDENYVVDFVKNFFCESLGWTSVKKSHDLLFSCDDDKLLVECKRYDSKHLQLSDHKGGASGESSVQELFRNLNEQKLLWGVLTDGRTFRLYKNDLQDECRQDRFIEICLSDIYDSTAPAPIELHVFLDIFSASSTLRNEQLTTPRFLSSKEISKIVRAIKKHDGSLHFVLLAIFAAALEDSGFRQLHLGKKSVRACSGPQDFSKVFDSLDLPDDVFEKVKVSVSSCLEVSKLFEGCLREIDLSAVDQSFLGTVYQKCINNGNAAHYTNSEMSRSMAEYIACKSTKAQTRSRAVRIQEGDLILDPAAGSGQLLRSLLPFHRVFFGDRFNGAAGWRELAKHLSARDIDADALWLAKLNIWLATAVTDEKFLPLSEFKQANTIEEVVYRPAGKSIKQALQIPSGARVIACISNPPWDVFKFYSTRSPQAHSETKSSTEDLKRALSIEVRDLNRSQVFTRIIQMLGREEKSMRFAVVLPDSFFIDRNQLFRDSVRPNLDFYFSFPRNRDPATQKKYFADVDATRKFGVIFGRSATKHKRVSCFPFGKDTPIVVDRTSAEIDDLNVFPLFSAAIQQVLVRKWKKAVTRHLRWHKGEFNQGNWTNQAERKEDKHSGTNLVISGSSFCVADSAWSRDQPTLKIFWKKMQTISSNDSKLARKARVLFSDYLQNSKKLNSASFLAGGANLACTVLYSLDGLPTDYQFYDSIVFSSFVEIYSTSQHMSCFRLEALGLPSPLRARNPLDANIEIMEKLDLTFDECIALYNLYIHWASLSVTPETWISAVSRSRGTIEEITALLEKVRGIKQPLEHLNQLPKQVGDVVQQHEKN